MIVNVHVIAVHKTQTVSVFKLLLVCVRIHKFGSYWQVIYDPKKTKYHQYNQQGL